MGANTSLVSLMSVVAIAFLIPIILDRFRIRFIPVVVAEIVVGLIMGKSGLNWIVEDSWLELLSLFGIIYLMFLSGLEIDFQSFYKRRSNQKQGMHPLKASLMIFSGMLVLSYLLSLLIGQLGILNDPFLMTIIIASISLSVTVPVLKERNLLETELGQAILLIAVISDLVTMVLLAVYISGKSESSSGLLLLVIFFVTVIAIYFILRRLVPKKVSELLRAGTVQIGTRAVFLLILLFVVLSESLHVEIILGAFLAGVVVSLLAPNKEFKHQLDTFGYGFLIPIFFVMIGVKLDLRTLLTDPDLLIFIPLLLAALFISKLIPSLLLRKWYTWKHALGSGLLLSSTLSLVVATATVALEAGIITDSMHGALILVAVLSCLIAPILFNRVFPEVERKKKMIAVVGANHITLPVTQDLHREGYEVRLFSVHPPEQDAKDKQKQQSARHAFVEVLALDIPSLTEQGTFEADVIVLGTADDEVNIGLARHAKQQGIENIIVRVESPEEHERMRKEEFTLFSTLYASRMLLKALIEQPSAVQLITEEDDAVREIRMDNGQYHNVHLRDLPFLGGILILRIYRGDSVIIPHGMTEIKVGDRLLVSGDPEQLFKMRKELE